MSQLRRGNSGFKRLLFWVLLSLALIVCVFRAFAPIFIRNNLNVYLANFSPVYEIHIGDISLSLFRGAYRFESIIGKQKSNGEKFLSVDLIEVSLSFRDFLRGRIVTDVTAEGANLLLTKSLLRQSDTPNGERLSEGKSVAAKLFPLRIDRIDLRSSSLEFAESLNLPKDLHWRLTSLTGRLTNLIPSRSQPFTQLIGHGTILDSADLKVAAKVDRISEPMDWEVDATLLHFELVKANRLLLNEVPLDFTHGHLDLYLEAISKAGKIEGYAKPFFENVAFLKKDKQYKGTKHFLIEIGAAILNSILRDSKEKTVAAKIPFRKAVGGEFEIDKGAMYSTVIQQGFKGGIEPGIEDKFKLDFPKHSDLAAQLKKQNVR